MAKGERANYKHLANDYLKQGKRGVKMNKFSFLIMTILLNINVYANTSQGQQLGIEAGNQGLGSANNAVNQNNGSQWLPGYSETAKEEGYYQDGMGNVNQSGYDKYTRCSNPNSVLTGR